MKKLIILSMSILCSCTISDSYYKAPAEDGRFPVGSVGAFGDCNYFLGFRFDDNCMPDRIAANHGITNITEIDSHWSWWGLGFTHTVTVSGDK